MDKIKNTHWINYDNSYFHTAIERSLKYSSVKKLYNKVKIAVYDIYANNKNWGGIFYS